MNILRLGDKTFIRLFLIIAFISLQSCSNTQIGEKLENSFDTTDNQAISVTSKKAKEKQKLKEITNIKSSKIKDEKENENIKGNTIKEKSISNKDRLSQKSNKTIKKVIFNPQPYRIILRLSDANPSAPAEMVTEALRQAGVQFEVEKIERFDDENLSKDKSLKR